MHWESGCDDGMTKEDSRRVVFFCSAADGGPDVHLPMGGF